MVITPHNRDITREFGHAFDLWHRQKYGRAVVLDVRTLGGTTDIKRQLEAMYRPYRKPDGSLLPESEVPADADVVWGGGDFFFYKELNRDLGLLRPLPLPAALLRDVFPEPTLAGVRLYDQPELPAWRFWGVRLIPLTELRDRLHLFPLPPRWVGVCLSSFGIVYNADLYDRLGLPEPTTWSDLTDPRLSGLVALADPTHSGSVSVAYTMVLQRRMAEAEEAYRLTLKGPYGKPPAAGKLNKKDPKYRAAIAEGWHQGMGELLLMAANARYFTDSASQVPADVGDGQAAAGVAIDFYGRVYQESVGPRRCRFVAPVAATAITPDPVGILYGVKGGRLELATHFVEFLLSRQGQELWIKKVGTPGGPVWRALRRPPVMAGLYQPGVDRSDWTDDVDPFTEAGGFNQRGEWMGLLTELRVVWAAAWIDARDALNDCHRAILNVEDASRRASLLAQLADVPVRMEDLEHQSAERAALSERRGDLDEWKARQRMDWAARFREHYRRVEALAR